MSRAPVVTDGVVAGNTYDKYGTGNPVARRLMRGFDASLYELLALAGEPASVLEVGCGEGHVTQKLARVYPNARVLGTDFSADIIAIARREHPGLRFEPQSIYDVPARADAWDLIVACEVFEHLEDPERALAALVRKAPRAVLLSVPHEPLWRMLNVLRGAHLGALGNTPGHLQHWSREAFLAFVARHAEVVAYRTPLPWTQVLCRPRKPA